MRFRLRKYRVTLEVEKYEFKNIKNMDKYDKNWLIVKVIYQSKDRKIIKEDPSLLVVELIQLKEWFNDIYNNKIVNSLNFTENELEFIYEKSHNTLTIELCFNLSLYDTKSANDKCFIIQLNPDKEYLQNIIGELDMYIEKFPIR